MSDTVTTTARSGVVEISASRTTIYDKLSPDLRHALDQAIVDRDPPTFRAAYDKFRLEAAGVSFYAFYRYARKLRTQADRLHLAELTLPDDAELGDAMPRLIGQRLLETLIYEETASPEALQRLTRAYRIATEASFARRRFAARLEDDQQNARTKETNHLLVAARQIAKAQATENHIQARVAQEAKAIFQNVADPPAIRSSAIRARPEASAPDAGAGNLLAPTAAGITSLSHRREEHRRERRRERHRRRRR
jgi:hypothetical protein